MTHSGHKKTKELDTIMVRGARTHNLKKHLRFETVAILRDKILMLKEQLLT